MAPGPEMFCAGDDQLCAGAQAESLTGATMPDSGRSERTAKEYLDLATQDASLPEPVSELRISAGHLPTAMGAK